MITPVKPTAEGCWKGREITNENMLCKLSLKGHVAKGIMIQWAVDLEDGMLST